MLAERRADGLRRVERQAGGGAQERHEQDVRVRQAGRRVARHAEERHAVDDRERRRLAGFDGDAVKDHRRRAPSTRSTIEIALADRAAAREHDHVRAGAAVERRDERVDRVLRRRMRFGDAAVCRDDGAEREAVDVVDLSGPERRSRLDRLRCRWTARRRAAARTPRARRSRWRRARRCGSGSAIAAPDDDVAGRDVGAAPADVLARPRPPRRCPHGRRRPASVSSTMTTASAPSGSGAPVAISAQVPGPIRLLAAAGRCRSDRRCAGEPADRALPARVGGDHGIAVHRGSRKRRNVDGRTDVGGRDAARRVRQRHPLGPRRSAGRSRRSRRRASSSVRWSDVER